MIENKGGRREGGERGEGGMDGFVGRETNRERKRQTGEEEQR